MNKTAKLAKLTKECFNKSMKNMEGKKINMYALFVRGFKTGYNQAKRELKK